jgi:soluble lytic murein transglycosylase-like protein
MRLFWTLPLIAVALGGQARATPIVDMQPAPPLGGLLADVAPASPAARERLYPILVAEAVKQGVPAALADAVAIVETGYTERALGSSGEIGLMQVMPGTATGLGFRGTQEELYVPATNIHYGVAYLARAWAASGGDACRALMKYRAGVGEEGFSPLSIQYCQRAGAWLRAHDVALADNVVRNTPAAPTLADPNVITLAGRRPARIDVAALAEIAGAPGMVVERLHAAWHISRNGRGQVDIKAVEEAAEGGDSDPHVIPVPASDP